MPSEKQITAAVLATVDQVLPRFGLAYLAGDDGGEWTVTKSTQGPGLTAIRAGQRLTLTVERHPGFTLVREYSAHG
jgi:hypothetical protein